VKPWIQANLSHGVPTYSLDVDVLRTENAVQDLAVYLNNEY